MPKWTNNLHLRLSEYGDDRVDKNFEIIDEKMPGDDSRNSTVKNKLFGSLDARLEETESDVSIKANKAQEAWITPTLLNGWIYFGSPFANVGYRKDQFGRVHLKGIIKSGTMGSAAFTLPVGYRPTQSKYYPVVSYSLFGMLTVTNTGEVRPQNGSVSWFALDGISFSVDE